MRNTVPKTITLPFDMASFVEAEVASGHYATDSEVIRDGLRALQARNQAHDRWLNEGLAAAYDRVRADPSRRMTREDFRTALRHDLENSVDRVTALSALADGATR